MRATTRLRQLLSSGKPLFVPGCYDALSARILETVGFPLLYMTGYGTSLALLGLPDAGLATMTEMHLNAREYPSSPKTRETYGVSSLRPGCRGDDMDLKLGRSGTPQDLPPRRPPSVPG